MTRYLAIVYRDERTYSNCGRGCCGTSSTDSLFETRYSEDRAEIVEFLVGSHVTAFFEEDSDAKYADRVHTLYIDGFPEDEIVDEFSDEDAEKRRLQAEMAEIRSEVAAAVEVQIGAAKAKAIEDKRLAAEKAIVDARAADVRRLADLERQRAALEEKLRGTP